MDALLDSYNDTFVRDVNILSVQIQFLNRMAHQIHSS